MNTKALFSATTAALLLAPSLAFAGGNTGGNSKLVGGLMVLAIIAIGVGAAVLTAWGLLWLICRKLPNAATLLVILLLSLAPMHAFAGDGPSRSESFDCGGSFAPVADGLARNPPPNAEWDCDGDMRAKRDVAEPNDEGCSCDLASVFSS